MQHTEIKYDPLHKGSSDGKQTLRPTRPALHTTLITELVIYRYPVPDKAIYDLKALFPTHDVCIMAVTTPDNKQDHHPSQFEAILTNALTTACLFAYPTHIPLTYAHTDRIHTRNKTG
jgi:hypothetical protein